MLADILSRHRGPYIFMIIRAASSKKSPRFTSEWLKGEVESDDVGPEALALLTDPRDTIDHIAVYSDREQQFVTLIRGEKDL